MSRFVYADNAATTELSKPVLDAMMPYLTEYYGNPSSLYHISDATKTAVETAREKVAAVFGAAPGEIFLRRAKRGRQLGHKRAPPTLL